MPVDRPTFSESWYRVAELRPRLRSTVQIHRQHYRGRMWHVLQDPSSNQFFRLNEAAYRFVALLDGRKTVAEVWRICQDQLGDSAPTQGEAIQLLGQLYTSNLLHAELPPDAEGLFKRHQRRVRREVQGYLMNLLFIRIPLIDPDNFLNAWVGAVGWLFSWFGLLLWLGLVGTGLYFVVNNWTGLYDRAESILDVGNLPLLYLAFILIKVCHEFGHAFMCKTFGRRTGTGGEVHVMGIMFLVFTPMPYVDASSAWAFRSRRHRILVGMGGMIIELGLAAIAAIIWANVREGTTLRAICYNAMFVASVSTILFNANPLLRYDGYYILSDLLEIPNLAQRSKQYIYYLVKKYAWGVRQARNPAHTTGEKGWFVFYGVASTAYRVFICIRILLFIADKLFLLGAVLAVAAAVTWALVPIGKFFHYLLTSGELMRVRGRAIATTALTIGLVVTGIGFIPAPDRFRLDGVVEPARRQIVTAAESGFVTEVLPDGRPVGPGAEPLARAVNPELDARLAQLLAERRRLTARRRLAQRDDLATAQILAEQIAAVDEQIRRVRRQLDDLTIHAALAGQWVSPDIDRARGAFVKRGEPLGMVASEDVLIRATADQDVVALLLEGPRNLCTLSLDADAAATLRRALAAAADANRPLRGTLATARRRDRPVRFTVERVAPAGTGRPAGPDTQPTSPGSAPTGAGVAAARPVEARIRLDRRDNHLLPLLRGIAEVRIAGTVLPDVPFRRRVNWRSVEMRIRGRPEPLMTARVVQVIEAGREQLPSAALGYAGGGSIRTDPKDPKGVRAKERFFELRLRPDPVDDPQSPWHGRVPLLPGQRVVLRVTMPPRPLASQWYRSILQLVQKRFKL